jgi:hypothetical protein
VQRWEGPIEEIRPGDGVWFAPGEKHWRGAAPLTAMTHVAIVEVLDGKSVDCSRKFEHDGPILGVEVDISSLRAWCASAIAMVPMPDVSSRRFLCSGLVTSSPHGRVV